MGRVLVASEWSSDRFWCVRARTVHAIDDVQCVGWESVTRVVRASTHRTIATMVQRAEAAFSERKATIEEAYDERLRLGVEDAVAGVA